MRDLAFIVTPFSLEDIELLRTLEPDAVKIASPDATNHPLLSAAASVGRPLIVSTGTSTLGELWFAANLVRRSGGCLLQCVSSYPTPPEQASIGGMVALSDAFRCAPGGAGHAGLAPNTTADRGDSGVAVGYSDHTTEVLTGALAVAAGACVIEKHITYDRGAAGPDHATSFEPACFAEYVGHIRRAALMLGRRCKDVGPGEDEVRRLSRQSVCAARDLGAGHVLTEQDLSLKRPGTGIAASRLGGLAGSRLARSVQAGDMLRESDLAS